MNIVIVSGYFNPLHSGHLDYFNAAKKLGEKLWVIINNDYQVALKGAVQFMSIEERIKIIEALSVVDKVFPSVDENASVIITLSNISKQHSNNHNLIFANGGDRKLDNTPEETYCLQNNIETVYGVGSEKIISSSKILENVKNNA